MRFDRLRLAGFKSFVEPAELHIRDGLTGVVGPNGCGKSNLLEALRWVMGESSARSLRVAAGGSGMDDVIFAGTAKRPSRDLAEVRLTLDNSARRAPAEFNSDDKLEVSRAIVRSEGSTYSLNGREVRLKDVQLLFADAATGAHSPALVSQGRVAAIINARPQERRQLLEEAAGISGLNVRRREAETRLRAADANLLRLDDVMKAADTQAAGLRRQAKSAQRYRELSERIRALEATLLRLQWMAAIEALQAAERSLQGSDAALTEAVQAAARAATAQADAAAGLPAKRQAEAAAAATLQRLTTERATLVAERAGLVQRLQDLQRALDNAAADSERERARVRDSAATQERLAEELAGQQKAHAEAEVAMPPQAAEVRSAEAAATEAERALATAVEGHAALMAEARSVRAQAEAARGRHERLEGERRRLQAELDRLRAGSSGTELESQLAEAEAALATRTSEAEAAAEAIAAAERDALAARAVAETVERALAAARTEVASLEAEAAALERLRTAKQSPANLGARASLSARPGFEAAAAAALGDDLNAALGAPEKPARHWLRVAAAADDPPLPAVCEPLAAQVTAPAELARRLAQVGVVDSPPSTETLAALKPGQRLVTRDGWLWRWDGFVAPPGGQAAAVAEALAQDNRRREIADSLAAPRERLAAAEAELAQQKAMLADAQQAERTARAARSEAERARDQLAGRLQGLRTALAQAAARTSAMEASIERLVAEGSGAAAEAEAAAVAIGALPDASAAAAAVAEARTQAERSRARLAQARAEAAALERGLAEALARISRLGREIADWQARDRDATAAREALAARVEKLNEERATLVAEPEALDARLGILDREIGIAEAARAAAAESVMAAELSQGDLDRSSRSAEALVADLREARATHSARTEQLREKAAELVADARERFGEEPAKLEQVEGAEADRIEQNLTSMRAERERIGIVNLRADIELAEIEAALAEQARERGELETAINRLRGSIGTLNREGRARLMAAFAEVDRQFRELFVTLFGGGSAELTMIESDDPLEAGLEIRAQPPGKKLQSLTLLSGGEQALTAIALIFALFRTNPAPICVLDEVDAPLDDANVERFTRLLKHMADVTDTRFLIVTHNAVTMAAMHRLYGVTMSEPGVSQLVSVELREAERLVAA
ncbi:chromosome segregation protein SMC [Sandaracinobacteroides hominis]|uniref:chromosome segregation protein SMC n=1 Tax=Sandaracinobacteroides hominis TaxID=2780086 RepID=UPI0018F74B40|nr:chromosome segregation protein SMC [Sandaracinobacteroides hominis]